ncbi:MAG: tRNA-dihydrouridine synthase family protein [Firmicutes bacterium]|nr:tRNA-dihydrouridine synthase family protein [Bacillota bacterium]
MEIHAAPLAGYTDHAFRRVLARCGARILYTEMVSATAMFYGSDKTINLLGHDRGVYNVVQLFGSRPEHFEFAIKSGHLDAFDEININMGCPAPKIIKNGEGSALMKNPELARRIIETCVRATTKPISVKMRLGFTEPIATVTEFAKMCEEAGAHRIIVHGRYTSQGYSGIANWNKIAEVVRSVKIPVIANGDVVDLESAKKCLDATGAAGLMIGRALMGAPWKIDPTFTPTPEFIRDIIKFHIETAIELNAYFPEMKKHLLFYCNHLSNSRDKKLLIAKAENFDEARKIMEI